MQVLLKQLCTCHRYCAHVVVRCPVRYHQVVVSIPWHGGSNKPLAGDAVPQTCPACARRRGSGLLVSSTSRGAWYELTELDPSMGSSLANAGGRSLPVTTPVITAINRSPYMHLSYQRKTQEGKVDLVPARRRRVVSCLPTGCGSEGFGTPGYQSLGRSSHA